MTLVSFFMFEFGLLLAFVFNKFHEQQIIAKAGGANILSPGSL